MIGAWLEKDRAAIKEDLDGAWQRFPGPRGDAAGRPEHRAAANGGWSPSAGH